MLELKYFDRQGLIIYYERQKGTMFLQTSAMTLPLNDRNPYRNSHAEES